MNLSIRMEDALSNEIYREFMRIFSNDVFKTSNLIERTNNHSRIIEFWSNKADIVLPFEKLFLAICNEVEEAIKNCPNNYVMDFATQEIFDRNGKIEIFCTTSGIRKLTCNKFKVSDVLKYKKIDGIMCGKFRITERY